MKYVFDLDGTLCTSTDGDYASASPILERIKKVNSLYESGNRIVILTARGMGRTSDNSQEASRLFESLTREQLNEWGVKYHALVMGKPAGDVYVDDKGERDNDFFKD
jgi:histidinol phosphatase-like enzyme